MNKYIETEKLIAEIERRIELLENGTGHPEVMKRVEGVIEAYNSILSFITSAQRDSLQVADVSKMELPDVDYLDEEIDNFFPESYFESAINFDDVVDIARHFYELGRNARKEK